MARAKHSVSIPGLIGRCGQRKVFLGFAPASLLHSLSFPDLLNENTGLGYQRRFSDKHSLDFQSYIQQPGSSTIPLTFNLRPSRNFAWTLEESNRGQAILRIRSSSEKVFAQVDCQHRLGYLSDDDVPLAFMAFIELTVEDEMKIFTVINSKAKGLNSSLLDFNDARLADDLGKERPELLMAIHLNEHKDSPWRNQLSLGGHATTGILRRASLRTIQKATKRFLQRTGAHKNKKPEELAEIIRHFWTAVAIVLDEQWSQPRKYFITKGIGVYSLMNIASDLYMEAADSGTECSQTYFVKVLSEFLGHFDWGTRGPLKGLGGQTGVSQATVLLKDLRRRKKLKVVHRGR